MRRARQQLSTIECERILNQNTSGILSLCGKDQQPYGVPLSYAYADHRIFFHVAKSGHKLDLIQENSKASFTVIDQDHVLPEAFTTKYKSVIVQGKLWIAKDPLKREGLIKLSEKYSPGFDPDPEIKRYGDQCEVLVLEIETCTGKQAKEYL
ncbi:pyridoxamine 5'-phosphate oxidase family protein [uncultured Faecalicoccus sp.]|uniref:pyridoxamine 5'-phosphate oxidase family protein n=1 Tax=uncultured Faecalicoccus sp. TaxID=1971760 RepID=UPI0025E50117|nr:pyridoxamine 5'-phosphate oxidase family protein [uncultured Faecalicoccus sp.]